MSVLEQSSPVYLTTARLRGEGIGRARLDRALERGDLVRVRRGRYVDGQTDPEVVRAAQLGGKVDCVSLLRRYGVFSTDPDRLHVQLTVGDSRLPPRPESCIGHWRATRAGTEDLVADLIEALVQACRCQPPRMAIATLDSSWHLGIVDEADIAEIFARLPRRFRALRRLLDRRSESGPETLVRLMLRGLGCRIEVQARIDGVGRVDFLVDGWLVIECDSREFHGSWEAQRRDLRRNLAAAERGYATLRVIAEDVLYHPDTVLRALRGIIHGRNSSRSGRGRAVAARRRAG